MTIGGGVVRSAMQVTIPLWQPELVEAGSSDPQAHKASAASAAA
jgi:hypothetical protein